MSQDNEIFRMNKNLCYFSNDERFLAIANQDSLSIKNTGTFDIFSTYTFSDTIENFEWSPDSEYILCYSNKKTTIQVFSIQHPEWKFKLIEGSCGLEYASWTPDSKHIITLADFKVQVSIWSLLDNSVTYIQNLKSSCNKVYEFSPDGKFLALIVNLNGQDSIHIHKIQDWKLSRKLICEGLQSIDGFRWSPNSELLSIWCSIKGVAKLIIYSTISESYEGIFIPNDSWQLTLKKEVHFTGFDEKLQGIEITKWMPSCQLLVVAGQNETITFLNCITWKPIIEIRLEPVVKENNYLTRVYKECTVKDLTQSSERNSDRNTNTQKHIIEEIGGRPVNVPIVKQELIVGTDLSTLSMHVIDILEFSSCGQYLAIRHQIYPSTLWIWDIRTNGSDILILQNPISGIKWDPVRPRLLAFTDSVYFFEWTTKECNCLESPRGMTAINFRWHPSSKFGVLCGYARGILFKFIERA